VKPGYRSSHPNTPLDNFHAATTEFYFSTLGKKTKWETYTNLSLPENRFTTLQSQQPDSEVTGFDRIFVISNIKYFN
jgi:hypothetical protein